MAVADPITGWIDGARGGDAEAARQLWEEFYRRMKGLARQARRPAGRGAYDEEDVALSAFAGFWFAVRSGRYERLDEPEQVWRLLATFTLREARQQARHARARKRWAPPSCSEAPAEEGEALDQLPDREPPPDLVVLMREQCRHLLELLPDPTLRAVARWRQEGHSNDEIAGLQGVSRRTVQRQLCLIRRAWHERGA